MLGPSLSKRNIPVICRLPFRLRGIYISCFFLEVQATCFFSLFIKELTLAPSPREES